MAAIKRLSWAMAFTANMERAVAFYRDVLGLPVRSESPGWSELDLGNGAALALHQGPPRQAGSTGGGWTLSFEVDDIAVLRRRLAAAGAQVRGEYHDIPGGVILDFADLDGNSLEVTQLGVSAADLAR